MQGRDERREDRGRGRRLFKALMALIGRPDQGRAAMASSSSRGALELIVAQAGD